MNDLDAVEMFKLVAAPFWTRIVSFWWLVPILAVGLVLVVVARMRGV